MKDAVLYKVKEFLRKYYLTEAPLLLGFSGGPDSVALLYLLLECKRFFPDLDLHLAHVDHGWRSESAAQASKLRDFAHLLNLPFHQGTLPKPEENESNLEAKARESRLRFFKDLYFQCGCQALLLGHHKNDQAETVLKRIFEGASLVSLGGLRAVSELYGMHIWRPLLNVSKQEIHHWLEEKGLQSLDDPTNRDPKFLRSRMRTHIFSRIESSFGKQIHGNLCYLADSSSELKAYFDRRTEPMFRQIKKGPFGSYLDFNPFFPIERLEIRAFFKKFGEVQELLLSHDNLELLEQLILSKAANKRLRFKNKWLFVDRGFFFFMEDPMLPFAVTGPLSSKEMIHNGWKWRCSYEPRSVYVETSSWKNLWLGAARVVLPKGDYELTPPDLTASFPRNTPIRKWWGNHYIPAFLRTIFPVISQKGEIVHEFLTGKSVLAGKLEPFVVFSLDITKIVSNLNKKFY